MKLYIIAVGHKMPDWVEIGFREYVKRMPREAQVELIELKPGQRAGSSVEKAMDTERERILAALPSGCRKIVLDERGANWTTMKLADKLKGWQREGGDVAFVIGGADGLHADIKRQADELLQLSALTMPHGMVRVLLAEQLYRAVAINQGHPYHRE
ncbi:23S rRNA (pseudouridine(1915)-N(3))-methyltransferase RlmH [Chitinimonas taiwanensis]|uniref:Ribosomal RNA large subunit methyltransferase H n=1 Tax=Chitinimonas taiwanensis DSM 18899 TaxID=1121279 RepID=A0A1K2H499_9NEIS|nr:23S rRNA (pseudouridine(1915)-N(3))-methyltransferase RlmH [Chitinimonas taiwanensis]SFZ70072.1 23S rRNA (pseudouridine1915-N3)-methyltransferase [Chitinimonas taiwanensis DSM 18899]